MSGQSEARGNLLSSIFGALLEEATLAKVLLGRSEYAQEGPVRQHLTTQSVHLEAQADQVWAWLRETAGLVEPEP